MLLQSWICLFSRTGMTGVSLVGLDLTPAVRLDQNILLRGAVQNFGVSSISSECNPHPKTGALAGFKSQCMSRKEWTYSRAVKICNGCHRVLFSLKKRTSHHSTIQNVKSSTKKEYDCHDTSCTVTGPYNTQRCLPLALWLKKSIQEYVAQGSRKGIA